MAEIVSEYFDFDWESLSPEEASVKRSNLGKLIDEMSNPTLKHEMRSVSEVMSQNFNSISTIKNLLAYDPGCFSCLSNILDDLRTVDASCRKRLANCYQEDVAERRAASVVVFRAKKVSRKKRRQYQSRQRILYKRRQGNANHQVPPSPFWYTQPMQGAYGPQPYPPGPHDPRSIPPGVYYPQAPTYRPGGQNFYSLPSQFVPAAMY